MKLFGLKEQQPHVIHDIVGGALFDFCAFLTRLPGDEAFMVGAAHEVPPLVKAMEVWAEMRGLSLLHPNVRRWEDYLEEKGNA